MPSYFLRGASDELWGAVKRRAVEDQIPLRELILALLRAYVERKVDVSAREVKAAS